MASDKSLVITEFPHMDANSGQLLPRGIMTDMAKGKSHVHGRCAQFSSFWSDAEYSKTWTDPVYHASVSQAYVSSWHKSSRY